ncbi:MAG: hypothetical protein IPO91_34565 [Chloroflexi bacterium]|nr:hypothetical protein [Chloroflexota bacterium]
MPITPQLARWRDPNTTKPTQAECDAEWAIYQQEEAAAAVEASAATADKERDHGAANRDRHAAHDDHV